MPKMNDRITIYCPEILAYSLTGLDVFPALAMTVKNQAGYPFSYGEDWR